MKVERVRRASYRLEYKLEAVRLVQGGQSCAATVKVLGTQNQTLENWIRQAAKGQLASCRGQAGKCGTNGIDATEGRSCKQIPS